MFFEISETLHNLYQNNVESISFLKKQNLTYENFFQNYMLQNKCCVIQNTTDTWGSSNYWLKNNDINFEYLRGRYGSLNVTVYNCLEKEFNSQKCYDTTFNNYLEYFEELSKNREVYDRLDYLKNWHLQLNTNDKFYEVPIYFASDWLNEYFISCSKDDYRFVYMGPTNTWTPFHADVFCSYSWSANICGRKKWLLFPPGEEKVSRDFLGNLPYDIADKKHILGKHFEVIQGPGEVIFVPSGWHHQVWNLEDTISINHNWINGCNIKTMYDSLKSNLDSIEKEIEDCKSMDDFQGHCQLMLNTLFGMNFSQFYDFLKTIALSRLAMLENKADKILFHSHEIGVNHIIFDLNAIKQVMFNFVTDEVVQSLNHFDNVDIRPSKLLEMIENILIK